MISHAHAIKMQLPVGKGFAVLVLGRVMFMVLLLFCLAGRFE